MRMHWQHGTRVLAALVLGGLLGLAHAATATATASATAELARLTDPVPEDAAELRRASPLPADWRHGTFMEIYVRGYQDSNGDGIGDLRGLIQRLDDLKALGVSGLWLMPITRSQDQDHGYAVTDYRDIEPDYGTLADFDALIHQAHARGIGIIMDYVINHSGADHPLFESARSSPASPYRDWYVWQDTIPAGWTIYGKTPWYGDDHGAYFAGFWDQMPDFNLRNPKVIAWHHDNLRFWLNRGLDGFRFDAVGNLVENGPLAWEGQAENHAIMAAVRQVVMRYPGRYMVCEAPGDPLAYGQDSSCGASFAFGHNNRLVSAAMGDPASLEYVLEYPQEAPASMASFATNHDSFAGQRLWDRLRADTARYRLAAALNLLLLPGPPFVYYGEEIGLAGGAGLSGDARLRTPMSWDTSRPAAGFSTVEPFRALSANAGENHLAAQKDDPGSLWSTYRDLIALRRSHPALLRGRSFAPAEGGFTAAIQRQSPEQHVLLAFNIKDGAQGWSVPGLPPGSVWRAIWTTGPKADSAAVPLTVAPDGQLALNLPGVSVTVLERQP